MRDQRPWGSNGARPRPALPLRQRILVGNLVTMVSLLLAGVFILWQVSELLNAVDTLRDAGQRVAVVTDVRHHADVIFSTIRRSAPEDPAATAAELSAPLEDLIRDRDRLSALLEETENEAIFFSLENVESRANNVIGLSRRVIRGSEEEAQEAIAIELAAMESLQVQMTTAVDRLLLLTSEQEEAAAARVATIRRAVILYPAMIVLFTIVLAAFSSWRVARGIADPVEQLTDGAARLAAGAFSERVPVERDDEIGQLAQAFNQMAEHLDVSYSEMEKRVTERTGELALAAEIGQRLTRLHNLDDLLTEAVQRIQDQFDLYYAQVYLTDPSGKILALRAGAGEVGTELVKRSHALPVARTSINGTAAVTREAVVIPNVHESRLFRPNSLLPETQSEMAVPLVIGSDRVLGVLNLQGNVPGELNAESLPAFRVLAGQLAIAVHNARLFEEAQEAQEELEAQMRSRVREGWENFLNAINRGEYIGFAYNGRETVPTSNPISEISAAKNQLSTQISVNGQPVGVISLEAGQGIHWSERDLEITNRVAEQVANQIESLRLLAEADRYRSEAEQTLRRFTQEGWDSYHELRGELARGYVYDGQQVTTLDEGGGDARVAVRRPLVVRGEEIGELALRANNNLAEAPTELVAAVAERLSAHLDNLRLSEQREAALTAARQRTEELQHLNQFVTDMAATLNLRESLQIVVRELIASTFADQARIGLLDEAREKLTIVAEEYDPSRSPSALGMEIPVKGNVLTQRVLETREAVIVLEADKDPLTEPIREMLREQGIKTLAVLPIVSANEVIGTAGIDLLDEGRSLTDDQIRLAETIVLQAGAAIQNARLFEQVQEALAQTELLYDVTSDLNVSAGLGALLEAAARPAMDEGAASAGLWLIENDEQGNAKWIEHTTSVAREDEQALPHGMRLHMPDFPMVEVWYADPTRTIFVEDLALADGVDPASRAILRQAGALAAVIAPLTRGARQIGVLSIFWDQAHAFTKADRRLYESVQTQAAVVLDRWLLLQEARRRAEKQRLINIISQKIQSAPTVESAMQVAVAELGDALQARRALVALDVGGDGNGNRSAQ